MKRFFYAIGAIIAAGFGYLLFWPTPIDPVSWEAPSNDGFTGDFALNDRLVDLELVPLLGEKGPEGLAVGLDGAIWTVTQKATLMRVDPETQQAEAVANLGGHPLELEFAPDGTLYYTDAFYGLRSWTPEGGVQEETTEIDGISFSFGEDLDIAKDGTIYFTIATTRHSPIDYGAIFPASLADIIEHQETGAVFRYDPATGEGTLIYQGWSFANGVALSEDETYLVVSELSSYRIWHIPLDGPEKHQPKLIVDGLPSGPDNVWRLDGDTFIIGLISPRSPLLDGLADKPFWRNVLMRLPTSVRPQPKLHTFLLVIDGRTGEVLQNLQDPNGGYPLSTGAVVAGGGLWVSSFRAAGLGYMPWKQ